MKQMGKLSRGVRILGVIGGALVITLGILIVIYSVSHRGFIVEEGRSYPVITFYDYMTAAAGILIMFLGYMLAHKGVGGVWL